MSGACPASSTGGQTVHGPAEWLCLAATPTFAGMALLTSVFGAGPTDILCAAGHGPPLHGMVAMYLLMSAFHSSPWLKRISGRRFRQA
jgi:hypothetical protein